MCSKHVLGAVLAASIISMSPAYAAPFALTTAVVQAGTSADLTAFDGVVEAVRQTEIAAQVSGVVIAVEVHAGDAVQAGQILLRVDDRAAVQNTKARQAQTETARAALQLASKELERQRQLYQKQYISQAAFERAQASHRTAVAQVQAQLAQANAAQAQSDFFVIKAPYAGTVASLITMQGDMAMPGRPLLTLYDPALLRVTASVPQSAVNAGRINDAGIELEVPALIPHARRIKPASVQFLPTSDAGTHTTQVRLALPAGLDGAAPGMFARVWLPSANSAATRLYIPARAILRRAELTGVYVISANQQPILRQVRLGPASGDMVEVLSGVAAGERVALDPQTAAQIRRD